MTHDSLNDPHVHNDTNRRGCSADCLVNSSSINPVARTLAAIVGTTERAVSYRGALREAAARLAMKIIDLT